MNFFNPFKLFLAYILPLCAQPDIKHWIFWAYILPWIYVVFYISWDTWSFLKSPIFSCAFFSNLLYMLFILCAASVVNLLFLGSGGCGCYFNSWHQKSTAALTKFRGWQNKTYPWASLWGELPYKSKPTISVLKSKVLITQSGNSKHQNVTHFIARD